MTAHNSTVGEMMKLAGDRFWWTVQAVDDRYAILTRKTPFRQDGVLTYTILDEKLGVRGPCNLIGQGWDIDSDAPQVGAEELLAALRIGEVEISHRNRVRTEITGRRSA